MKQLKMNKICRGGGKIAAFLVVAVIVCLAASDATAATCLVSDPLGHTDDTPIAGTYTTSTSSASSSLDSRSWTAFLADGWTLFKQIGFILSIR